MKYTVILKTSYEVDDAKNGMTANLAAIALANGCTKSTDILGRSHELLGCRVTACKSVAVEVIPSKQEIEKAAE